MAVSPSVSINATFRLQSCALKISAIWRSRPGRSCATTCTRVECEEDSESNLTRVVTSTLMSSAVHVAARFEQLCHLDLLRHYIVHVFEEAFALAWVQFEGAEAVDELEAVDDHALVVRKGAGADDVHAPGGQRSGHVGKQPRAVARNHVRSSR